MSHSIITGFLIFAVAVVMTMVGKGGGNFYVVILAMANIPMHEAATTGQFILFSASLMAMLVFQRKRSVSWALAALVGSFTALSALGGGYFSHLFSGFTLKIIFALMLIVSGVVMLVPVSDGRRIARKNSFATITIKSGGLEFRVNLAVTVPITIMTGLGAGMVGVSGGSFLVPLMVLAYGVPMYTAVGTASVLISVTALMGFTGHAFRGDFNPSWAIPLALITIAGGLLGGIFALKTKPVHLKKLFALTNIAAALFMIMNAYQSGR